MYKKKLRVRVRTLPSLHLIQNSTSFLFIINILFYPQSAFFPWSAVCSLHFTLSLHFSPGLQSAFYTDRYVIKKRKTSRSWHDCFVFAMKRKIVWTSKQNSLIMQQETLQSEPLYRDCIKRLKATFE